MSGLDHFIIGLYLLGLYLITWFSMKSTPVSITHLSERKQAEYQFLAGRQASMMEAVFSIVATEFSAMTFVQLPALVMLGKRGLLWGLVGVVIGRLIISRFLLKNFYRSGITVFDSLSRGVKHYNETSKSAQRAQRLMALIYFFSKVLSVSAAMYLGVSFIARFYGWSYELVLVFVVFMTALYTISGGLKAVMRTDILQFFSIILGGGVLVYLAMEKVGDHGVVDTVKAASKAAFGTSGLIPIITGITTGFVSDFSTHGVEQDFVQKLKACKSPSIAARAVVWSTWLTIGLQALFICIGAALMINLPEVRGGLTVAIDVFMDQTVGHLWPGGRGLVVVAILAATMSSLDSSLNALSAVLWNDILPGERASRYPLFLKVDNSVVAIFVMMFAYFVGQHPMYIKGFLKLNFYVLLPLVCCFLIRFMCYPWMKFSFGLHTVVFTILSCFVGWIINTIYIGFPSQMAIFICLGISVFTIWYYEKLKLWI